MRVALDFIMLLVRRSLWLVIGRVFPMIQGDQRELRKSMTLLLRLRGSVGTKTYGKISLRSGHFDIWLLKYPKKLFSSKLRYVKKLSDFHI